MRVAVPKLSDMLKWKPLLIHTSSAYVIDYNRNLIYLNFYISTPFANWFCYSFKNR